MKESIIERNKRLGVDKKIADFMTKQRQPYEFKVRYAELRAWEFYEECGRRSTRWCFTETDCRNSTTAGR